MLETKKNIVGKVLLVQRIVDSMKSNHNVSLSKNNVSLVFERMWGEIIDALKKREEVRLVGYCTFKCAKTKSRTAMNLRTNKKIIIPEKTVPKIKISQTIKQEVAKSFDGKKK